MDEMLPENFRLAVDGKKYINISENEERLDKSAYLYAVGIIVCMWIWYTTI